MAHPVTRSANVVGEHDIGGITPGGRSTKTTAIPAATSGSRQVIGGSGDDDQTVDTARAERQRELALAFGIFVAGTHEQQRSVAVRNILDGTRQGRVEGVADIFEH